MTRQETRTVVRCLEELGKHVNIGRKEISAHQLTRATPPATIMPRADPETVFMPAAPVA